jgi:hypothetical protein
MGTGKLGSNTIKCPSFPDSHWTCPHKTILSRKECVFAAWYEKAVEGWEPRSIRTQEPQSEKHHRILLWSWPPRSIKSGNVFSQYKRAAFGMVLELNNSCKELIPPPNSGTLERSIEQSVFAVKFHWPNNSSRYKVSIKASCQILRILPYDFLPYSPTSFCRMRLALELYAFYTENQCPSHAPRLRQCVKELIKTINLINY